MFVSFRYQVIYMIPSGEELQWTLKLKAAAQTLLLLKFDSDLIREATALPPYSSIQFNWFLVSSSNWSLKSSVYFDIL